MNTHFFFSENTLYQQNHQCHLIIKGFECRQQEDWITNKTITYYTICVMMSSCSCLFICFAYELIMMLDYVQKVNTCYVIAMTFHCCSTFPSHCIISSQRINYINTAICVECVSDCCVMPNQQFFRYIMAGTRIVEMIMMMMSVLY